MNEALARIRVLQRYVEGPSTSLLSRGDEVSQDGSGALLAQTTVHVAGSIGSLHCFTGCASGGQVGPAGTHSFQHWPSPGGGGGGGGALGSLGSPPGAAPPEHMVCCIVPGGHAPSGTQAGVHAGGGGAEPGSAWPMVPSPGAGAFGSVGSGWGGGGGPQSVS